MGIHKLLKSVSIALVAVMAIGTGIVTYSNEAQAADEIVPTSIQWVTVDNAKTTYADLDKAPKAVDCGLTEDYLFAGWYTAENGDVLSEVTTSSAVAKFVPAYILGVKSQVAYNNGEEFDPNVTENSDSVYLRMVSAVDSTNYQEVGFNITATPSGASKESEWNTKTYKTKVYSFLKQYSETEQTYKDVSASAVFGTGAQYFFSYTVRNIPTNNLGTAFYATPYWVTMDGTKVTGLAKYVHVEDYYKDLISVPVYLKSSTEAAAGIATVAYDDDNLEFYGYENGKLFEEGLAKDHGTGTGTGTVKCVANVSELKNKEADGLFINLRFQVEADATATSYTFDVTASPDDFCNINEELISTISGGKIVAYDIKY